ncbi:acyltransferase-domain-containing protein, partial [Pseudovirgaria hyperparasitica]
MWQSLAIGITLAIVVLHASTFFLPPVMGKYASFAARGITSWLALGVCACYGILASIVLRLVGFGGLSQWTTARAMKWTMWLVTGVTFEVVRGEEYLSEKYDLDDEEDRKVGRKSRVILGNHQTSLDVLMLGCIFPKYCSVTAKKSLKLVPFLGWFMALSKTVFIDRANSTSARATFNSAATTMRSTRQSVYIFPEGTRSYASTPTLLPFKKGAFHLAVQAQVPIVPVVVANYAHILDSKRKIFKGGVIPVVVLEPVKTKGLTAEDVDSLVVKV